MMDAIPKVDAVRPARGPARWKAIWSRRHTAAAVVLTPALAAGYWVAAGALTASWPVDALVVLAGALGAFVLASYLPARGTRRAAASGACGLMPLLGVAGAAWAISQTPASAYNVVVATVLLGVVAAQRLVGSDSCG